MSDNHQQQPSQTVTLLQNEWQVVRAGLAELPLKFSLAVMAKLEQQLATPPVNKVSEIAPKETTSP